MAPAADAPTKRGILTPFELERLDFFCAVAAAATAAEEDGTASDDFVEEGEVAFFFTFFFEEEENWDVDSEEATAVTFGP